MVRRDHGGGSELQQAIGIITHSESSALSDPSIWPYPIITTSIPQSSQSRTEDELDEVIEDACLRLQNRGAVITILDDTGVYQHSPSTPLCATSPDQIEENGHDTRLTGRRNKESWPMIEGGAFLIPSLQTIYGPGIGVISRYSNPYALKSPRYAPGWDFQGVWKVLDSQSAWYHTSPLSTSSASSATSGSGHLIDQDRLRDLTQTATSLLSAPSLSPSLSPSPFRTSILILHDPIFAHYTTPLKQALNALGYGQVGVYDIVNAARSVFVGYVPGGIRGEKWIRKDGLSDRVEDYTIISRERID